VAELARRSEVFTRADLRGAGLGDRTISKRCKARRLFRVYRAVYSLTPRVSPLARIRAATLSTGAAASHFAGLHGYGLTASFTGAVDVTSPRDVARQPGLRPHRVRCEFEPMIRHGIPLVPPPLLFAQLGRSSLSYEGFRRVVNEAITLELTDEDELRAVARGRLKRLLDDGVGRTRSSFEDRFPPWASRHGLAGYLLNALIHGVEVDVYFPEQRVVLELDGKWHRPRPRQVTDRRKQARLEALGERVLRAEALDDELVKRLTHAGIPISCPQQESRRAPSVPGSTSTSRTR
jgi:hypothetical protein